MHSILIIDGVELGKVIGYRQNRELQRWVFLMEAGYYIGVDFSNIKFFDSGHNTGKAHHLTITTFQASTHSA